MEILSNNTPEKWEEVKTHPFYADELAKLKREAEEYLVTPVPATPYTAYLRFRVDGDRTSYEKPYFARRRRLAVLSLFTKLYGEKYLPALLDVIWAVTEEFTWCLPAHMILPWYNEKGYRTAIDLFATETGALLAETVHVLGDLLPEAVRERVRVNVKERIMDSYVEGPCGSWWMDGENNWGAVCTAQVALCFMYLGEAGEIYRLEPLFDRTMNLFLASYGKDGCCTEGLSYWRYGFGLFLLYADAMRNYSRENRMISHNEKRAAFDGKAYRNAETGVIDYFVREDVKRAADFSMSMYLTGGHSVSFSDGPRSFKYARMLHWILKKEYGDAVVYPDPSLVVPYVSSGSLGLLRHFLWSDPSAEHGAKPVMGTTLFEETAWFIKKTPLYSFAAKAGHNHEAHNHNDVGSFHLVTESGETFVDLGAGEYTRQYFTAETRYTLLVNRSLGHSVPYINGKEQVFASKEHAVPMPVSVMNDDSFAFDMAKAYGIPTLTSAVRRFDTDEKGVTLTDTFSFTESPNSLVERFVSALPPTVEEGRVTVGGATLNFDPALFTASVAKEEYRTHQHEDAVAWFTDLTVKKPQKEMTLSFRIDVEK